MSISHDTDTCIEQNYNYFFSEKCLRKRKVATQTHILRRRTIIGL